MLVTSVTYTILSSGMMVCYEGTHGVLTIEVVRLANILPCCRDYVTYDEGRERICEMGLS